MDYIAELAAIAKEHGGIIETKIAAQHGISKAILSATITQLSIWNRLDIRMNGHG